MNDIAVVDSLSIESVLELGVSKAEIAEVAFNTSWVGDDRENADHKFDKAVAIFGEPLPYCDKIQGHVLQVSRQWDSRPNAKGKSYLFFKFGL